MMGAIGRMGLIVMGRYPLTGCGCWYWPRSGVHRRFWVGDGRPTAAGAACLLRQSIMAMM